MEIVPEQPSVNKTTRSASVQLSHKRVSLFSRSLLLVTVVILAGIPVATCIPASTNNFMLSNAALRFIDCDGDKPGFCPDGPFVNT